MFGHFIAVLLSFLLFSLSFLFLGQDHQTMSSVEPDQVSRHVGACDNCREQKVRCMRQTSDSDPCARCAKYVLNCTVTKNRSRPRGRPPKEDNRPTRFASASRSSMASGSAGPSGPPGSSRPPALGSTSAGPSNISPATPLGIRQHYTNEPNSDSTPNADSEATRAPGHNLSQYLEPSEPVVPREPFFHNIPERRNPLSHLATVAGAVDDPIGLSLLSDIEAQQLVHLFHEHLNPHIAILDPTLHTLNRLRASTVLCTAVLASSARFFRKDLSGALLQHSRTLADRALLAGVADVSLVQSLMLATYFKDPTDTSAWRKIGAATRIGYQLRWHEPRNGPLPEDEAEAREILNVERTWLCLYCFDHGLAQTFNLPHTIRFSELPYPDFWAASHSRLSLGIDRHLAIAIDLSRIKDRWRLTFKNTPQSSSLLIDSIRSNVLTETESLYNRWFTYNHLSSAFDPSKELVLKWCMLDFMLVLSRHRLLHSRDDPWIIDRCLEIACTIVETISTLAEQNVLTYLQDTSSCMTSSLAVLLQTIFFIGSVTHKQVVMNQLQQLLVANSLSCQDSNAPTAYVARYIKKISDSMQSRSKAASPTPQAGDNTMAVMEADTSDINFDALFARMDETFQSTQDFGCLGHADEQYWASLFSANADLPTNDEFLALTHM